MRTRRQAGQRCDFRRDIRAQLKVKKSKKHCFPFKNKVKIQWFSRIFAPEEAQDSLDLLAGRPRRFSRAPEEAQGGLDLFDGGPREHLQDRGDLGVAGRDRGRRRCSRKTSSTKTGSCSTSPRTSTEEDKSYSREWMRSDHYQWLR